MNASSRLHAVLAWTLRLVAAGILTQTLFFKFSGAEESRWIFGQLGAEPWGRLGAGVLELTAAVLLLVPRTVLLGALLTAAAMLAALASHALVLGIEVQGDGGSLFTLALIALACALGVLWLRWPRPGLIPGPERS